MSALAFFGIVLAIILGAMAWVDSKRLIIPDALNLILAASGLAYQSMVSPGALWVHAAMGAAMFGAFWLIRGVHATATGRVGLGLGDVKMAGASAIWLNPWNLPFFVFAASLSALVFAFGRHLLHKRLSADTRQPFGPFLAAGLLLTWLCEQQFSYLRGP